MNRSIRRVSAVVMTCFVLLFAQLNRVQVVEADKLSNRSDNTRKIERDFNRNRGDIVSADLKLLAHSEPIPGKFKFQRQYPTGELFAHVVGNFSWIYGADGVERQYNDELAGQTPAFTLDHLANPLAADTNVGTVNLTLRADVQQAAKDALGDRQGSVVAIDPRTGSIIAMYSNPTYDPNVISNNDPNTAKSARTALLADPEKPTLSRAYREKFAPGSTFKIVTATAGLESGVLSTTTPEFPRARSYTPPLTNRPISNFSKSECGGTLIEITRVSCNSAFAELGAEFIGPDQLIASAQLFGFNRAVPIDLPGAASATIPTTFGDFVKNNPTPGRAPIVSDTPGLALASIGQGDVAATPLQMALVAAAIANEGTLMVPHVMDTITGTDNRVVERNEPRVLSIVTTSDHAAILRKAMEEVANAGTAQAARIAGKVVGAKTGTAQIGTAEQSHAWTIAYAGPAGAPAEIAVAVLVEAQPGVNEQTGGKVAAPIAQRVMQLALTPLPQVGTR